MSRSLTGLIGVTCVIGEASLLFGGRRLLWMERVLTEAEGDINTAPMEAEVARMSFEIAVGMRVPLIRPISIGLAIGGGVRLALETILLVLAL